LSKDLVLIGKTGAEKLKLIISVSKKVAPKAVDRNRIKRIIKESLGVNKRAKGEIKIIVKKNKTKSYLKNYEQSNNYLV